MKFSVKLVNPRTSQERTIVIDADEALANAAPCLQTYVQDIARRSMAAGFMPCGNGVRALLQ